MNNLRWKLWCIFMFFLLIPANGYAQEQKTPAPKISLGGKIGLTIVTTVGDDADVEASQTTNKLSVALGGVANIAFNRFLGIQPEILYMSKGTNIENNGAQVGTLTKRYLEMLLLARFDVPIRGTIRPYGLIGPGLGYLLDATYESASGMTLDVTDRAKTLDPLLLLGAGATYALPSRSSLVLEARYEPSLRSGDGTGRDLDLKNRAFSIMLGYQYWLY